MKLSVLLASAFFVIGGTAQAAMEPKSPASPAVCSGGKVYDARTKKCVTPGNAALDDETLYVAGREFARDGRYEHALAALEAIEEQEQAKVLTIMGYSLRKSGEFELGLEHYAAALDLDPDYHLARAYLGMAMMERDNLTGAWAQYHEIEARGGKGTWAHTALREAIETGTGYE